MKEATRIVGAGDEENDYAAVRCEQVRLVVAI